MFEGLLQPMHWVIIGFLILIFWGPKNLAARGKDLAEGLRGLTKSLDSGGTPPSPPKQH